VLRLQSVQPLDLLAALDAWLGLFCEHEEVRYVPPLRLLFALPEFLQSVLPDRLEHPVAYAVALLVGLGQD
jgi:hypothetical protein